jgi:uncharacterized protein (DUF362 family)
LVVSTESLLDTLAGQAEAGGGWGYTVGHGAHLEPTCLSLLALRANQNAYAEVIDKGLAFLKQCALPDGCYRLERGRQEALWTTAMVLFVLAHHEIHADNVKHTASFLLALKGQKGNPKDSAEVNDINLELIGWPWAAGNFSWVEPTAWACLALRKVGLETSERVEEGLNLLLDRAFEDGGINYGNRCILGRTTDPIPGPTALMLLALQGRDQEPKVRAAAAYLLDHVLAWTDVEHLCWAKLALDCHRELPGMEEALAKLDEHIKQAYEERLETQWLRPAPLRTALAALALATKRGNPFQLPTSNFELRPSAEDRRSKIEDREVGGPVRKLPWPDRLAAGIRGLAVQAVGRLRQLPPQSGVHIARASGYGDNLADVLVRQFESFRERVPLGGKRVVLKPNLVEYHRDKVINTNPQVVAAAIELCRREGAAEVVVAEGPGHWRNVEYLVSASGLGDVLRHYKVSFIDLNHDEPVKTPNLGRLTGMEFLYIARTIAAADVFISLPKLKTHHWAGATLSLKNLFGTLPGICYGWPKNELHWRGIDNSIVDIALTRTPDLAIVDGIVGMEGDGPLNGTPRPLGAIVMGCDLLAVDATCCRLMQLDPERIAYLCLGYQKKLGRLKSQEIPELGESIKEVSQAFATVPHFDRLRALSA